MKEVEAFVGMMGVQAARATLTRHWGSEKRGACLAPVRRAAGAAAAVAPAAQVTWVKGLRAAAVPVWAQGWGAVMDVKLVL